MKLNARQIAFNEQRDKWLERNPAYAAVPLTEREKEIAAGAMACGWNNALTWAAQRMEIDAIDLPQDGQ